MSLNILSSVLQSHEEVENRRTNVCTLGKYNGRPSTSRFNDIYDIIHENEEMFRDTNILRDYKCKHINNGCQTCSWLDHFAMSDVLSESIVDCLILPDALTKLVDRKAMVPSVTEVSVANSPLR